MGEPTPEPTPEPTNANSMTAPEVVRKTLKETGLKQAKQRFSQLQEALTNNPKIVVDLTRGNDPIHQIMLTRTLEDFGTMLGVVEDAFRGGIVENTEVERPYQTGGLNQKVSIVVIPHGNISLTHYDIQKFGADEAAERRSGLITISPEGALQATGFCTVRDAKTPNGVLTSATSYDLNMTQARKEGMFEYWGANVDLTTHTTDFQPMGSSSIFTHTEQTPKTSGLKVAQNQSGTTISSNAPGTR